MARTAADLYPAYTDATAIKRGDVVPAYIPGNDTIHVAKVVGTLESGAPKLQGLCGITRRARHYPMHRPGNEVTCKRCLS